MAKVTGEESGTNGLRRAAEHMAIFFHVNDGLLALMRMERLHWAFNVLDNLFDWVGILKTLGTCKR